MATAKALARLVFLFAMDLSKILMKQKPSDCHGFTEIQRLRVFSKFQYIATFLTTTLVSTIAHPQRASALLFDGSLLPIKTAMTTALTSLGLATLSTKIEGIITIGQVIAIAVVAIMMIWIFIGIASKPSQLNDVRQVVTELWIPIVVLIVAAVVDVLLNLLVNFNGGGAAA
jgi:hypothetical protein